MISERARITAIAGGQMVLEPISSACSSCGSAKSCGTSKLAKLLPSGQRRLVLPLEPGRRVGEEVALTLPESALLAATVVAYLPPLVGLMAGVMAGGAGAGGPIGAGVGLVLGLLVSRWLSRGLAGRFDPILVGRHAAPHPVFPIHKE
ncbi:MAG: SoxR reducing system RseC family protein [Rhodocyclaceae bacterium]|jgi:sigma-E factor negative regulatory protein RseC|nr:SoxR reducing system RseC family protein [Rhodocyclaceae bacterium]